jgi:signal recognition particle subunit SRP54
MLENLSSKLQKILRDLRGEGKLSEKHIDAAMREVRLALLEADVNFKVVKEFVDRVKAKALGQEVMQSLTPAHQVVKIVRDELTELLGGLSQEINFSKTPPSVFLMAGLQGSGKTTTSGKLALWLRKNKRTPLLLPVDVYRPAAIEQLKVIGQELGIPTFTKEGVTSPVELCKLGITHAKNTGYDAVIVDTAGRLHVDEELMKELREIKAQTNPAEVLLVADAMTGQDAVKSAQAFHESVGVTGIVLTKLDGDARGGAALSIKSVVGQPIKFIGVGEKYDALEKFFPDRLVGRILGMGDMLSFIERAETMVEEEKAMELAKKIQEDQFTLADLRDQFKQLRKMGSLRELLNMMPNIGPFKGMSNLNVDEKEIVHMTAIIDSMTAKEQNHPKLIDGSRRRRIAMGSGRPVQEVNRLLKQYDEVRKMMKGFKGMFTKKLLGGKSPKSPF